MYGGHSAIRHSKYEPEVLSTIQHVPLFIFYDTILLLRKQPGRGKLTTITAPISLDFLISDFQTSLGFGNTEKQNG